MILRTPYPPPWKTTNGIINNGDKLDNNSAHPAMNAEAKHAQQIANTEIYLSNASIINLPVTCIGPIMDAAKSRNDAVYYYLQPHADEIMQGELKVKFHTDCHSKYTSSTNIKYAISENKDQTSSSEENTNYSRSVRDSDFNIRKDCFVCGNMNKYKKVKWVHTLVNLTPISTVTCDSARTKTLEAAVNASSASTDSQLKEDSGLAR